MNFTNNYVSEITELFKAHANPRNALPMKKYMKDLFEFYGIKTPERDELCKSYLKKENLPPVNQLNKIVKMFWALPQREFQYYAMRLTHKQLNHLEEDFIDLFEFMITNKSWWDTVDFIASNLVGGHFKKHSKLIIPKSQLWLESNNIWLQRTSLLFQLKYKSKTDTGILFNNIKHLSKSEEFFIRKAIGWSLREYSKTDPAAVLKFVTANELSNLSKKEALRLIR
ncbi:MAG: DNA alkylation repair protein [Bacteroidetes bacterium]|nr:DNA alkylation repair protein [Bacteroidota bacterium]